MSNFFLGSFLWSLFKLIHLDFLILLIWFLTALIYTIFYTLSHLLIWKINLLLFLLLFTINIIKNVESRRSWWIWKSSLVSFDHRFSFCGILTFKRLCWFFAFIVLLAWWRIRGRELQIDSHHFILLEPVKVLSEKWNFYGHHLFSSNFNRTLDLFSHGYIFWRWLIILLFILHLLFHFLIHWILWLCITINLRHLMTSKLGQSFSALISGVCHSHHTSSIKYIRLLISGIWNS